MHHNKHQWCVNFSVQIIHRIRWTYWSLCFKFSWRQKLILKTPCDVQEFFCRVLYYKMFLQSVLTIQFTSSKTPLKKSHYNVVVEIIQFTTSTSASTVKMLTALTHFASCFFSKTFYLYKLITGIDTKYLFSLHKISY